MTRRPQARAMLLALAFLALAALPLAAADHAYSHRYIVWGRVVDAENNPVPGLTVDLGYEKPFAPEGACANQPGTETTAFGPTRTSPITNEFGEFTFCFHTHSMSRTTPGAGTLRIDSLDLEKRFEFDGFMRYSYVPFKLDTVQPTANKTVAGEFYTVQGRAWQASGTAIQIESVRVYGDTLHNKPINITFEYNGKPPMYPTDATGAPLNITTNNYGDYSYRFPVTERPTSGKVTVVIENHTFTSDIDPALGATYLRSEVDVPKDPFVTKFLIGLGIFGAVVVVGGGLWWTSGRMKRSREERIMREQTSRKRANK